MRPNETRRYTVTGRFGVYAVPSLGATDNRLRSLVALLGTAKPDVAARIRHDLDLLLEWRFELMAERGSTT